MTSPTAPRPFPTEAYLRARRAEGRLFDDGLATRLPHLPRRHPLAAEWRLRAESAARLAAAVSRLPAPRVVVDVGCGSGWLARFMARVPATRVVAVDLPSPELEQARRLSTGIANLAIREGDARTLDVAAEPPDVIVLASVIQYLPDPVSVIARLVGQCAPRGAVHVIDSPLYDPADLAAAATRSQAHYDALGVPQMAAAYHHHSWAELARLSPVVVWRPPSPAVRRLARLVGGSSSPFPWLRFDRAG